MPAEPVAITDVFLHVSKKMVEAMQSRPEITEDEIADAVALEFGVPLDQAIEACHKQSRVGLIFAAVKGPQRGIATSMLVAFIAGVAWEQGRRG